MLLDKIFQLSDIKLEISSEIKEKSLFGSSVPKKGEKLRQNGLTEVRNILLMKQLSEIISESAYHELMKKLELFRKNADAERPDYYTVIEISLTEQDTT